jgi:hypothetical protein
MMLIVERFNPKVLRIACHFRLRRTFQLNSIFLFRTARMQATNQARAKNSSLEEQLPAAEQEHASKLKMTNSVQNAITELDKQDAVCAKDTGEELKLQNQLDQNVAQSIAAKRVEIANSTKQYHESWEGLLKLQKSEGHPPSLPPSATTQTPVLDLNAIRFTEAAEVKAHIDETASKNELRVEVESMKAELKKLNVELPSKQAQTGAMKEANSEAFKLETRRKDELHSFAEKFLGAKKQCKDYLETIPAMYKQRDDKVTELIEKARIAKNELQKTEKAHLDDKREWNIVKEESNAVQTELKTVVDANGKVKVAQAEEAYSGLKLAAEDVREQRMEAEYLFVDHNMTEEEMKLESDALLEGK